MNSRNGVAWLALSACVLAGWASAAESPLAEVTVGGSRVDFRPLGTFGCLQLTVTGPDVTIEKQFGAEASPSVELPYPAPDGAYRWQLSRLDQACSTPEGKTPGVTAPAPGILPAPPPAAADDHNGRAAAKHGKPDRTASGPYQQSGGFRVANGTIVIPSNAVEPGGKK